MSRQRRQAPEFADEADERAFCATHDTTDYVDWAAARPIRLPKLKPSTTTISLRLPVALLERIKLAAHQRDVPYQSLIKLWLAERVESGRQR